MPIFSPLSPSLFQLKKEMVEWKKNAHGKPLEAKANMSIHDIINKQSRHCSQKAVNKDYHSLTQKEGRMGSKYSNKGNNIRKEADLFPHLGAQSGHPIALNALPPAGEIH